MVGEPVVLVNRTPIDLQFTADGRHYVLKPGPNYGFVQGHSLFAVKQNPMWGTEDYSTLEYISMIGIEGNPDWPCDPISADELKAALDIEERFDRANSAELRKKVKEKGKAARLARIDGANQNAMAIGG